MFPSKHWARDAEIPDSKSTFISHNVFVRHEMHAIVSSESPRSLYAKNSNGKDFGQRNEEIEGKCLMWQNGSFFLNR